MAFQDYCRSCGEKIAPDLAVCDDCVAEGVDRHRTQTDAPELDFCSSCKEHSAYYYSEAEGWLSECCAAHPVSCDVEPAETWE